MAFNVAPVVPPITGFTATPGVESAVLSWVLTDGFPVQVWRDGTLIATVLEDGFVDGSLPADAQVSYMVRAARTLSTGGLAFGTSASATVTPARAELGTGQVQTVHVATEAITTRNSYQSEDLIYVRAGRDEGFNLAEPHEAEDWSGDIFFTGTGSPMVIACKARVGVAYVIPREPSQMVARVKAHIAVAEDADPDNWWLPVNTIDEYEAAVYVVDYKTRTPDVTDLAMFTFSRDYDNTFIVDTDPGVTYRIKFVQTVTTNGNDDNYILLQTDLRQVLWSEFKR